MFTRTVACLLVIALALSGSPLLAAATQGVPLAGTVQDQSGKPVAGACIRLVNVDSGQQVATTKTDGAGKYEITGIKPGNYYVEVRDAACQKVVQTSAPLVVADAAVTGTLIVVGEAAAAGGFFSSTAGVLLLAGAAAGVIAIVVTKNEASPGVK